MKRGRGGGGSLSERTGLWIRRTCDVPELKPDRLRIPVQHLQGEVHADGGPVVVGVGLVHVAPDDGGFPDSQVSDHQHLVQALLPEALHAVGVRRVVAHAPCGTRSRQLPAALARCCRRASVWPLWPRISLLSWKRPPCVEVSDAFKGWPWTCTSHAACRPRCCHRFGAHVRMRSQVPKADLMNCFCTFSLFFLVFSVWKNEGKLWSV